MRENNYWLPVILGIVLFPVGVITGCAVGCFYYQQLMQGRMLTELGNSIRELSAKNIAQEESLKLQQLKLEELDDQLSRITPVLKGFDHMLFHQLKILLELNDISELTTNSNINILRLQQTLISFCNEFEDFAQYAQIFENSLLEEELEDAENKIKLLKEVGEFAARLGLRQTANFVENNLQLQGENTVRFPAPTTIIQHIDSPTINILNIHTPDREVVRFSTATPIPFNMDQELLGDETDDIIIKD